MLLSHRRHALPDRPQRPLRPSLAVLPALEPGGRSRRSVVAKFAGLDAQLVREQLQQLRDQVATPVNLMMASTALSTAGRAFARRAAVDGFVAEACQLLHLQDREELQVSRGLEGSMAPLAG